MRTSLSTAGDLEASRAGFGLVHLPFSFYLFLIAAVAGYLALVEVVKRLFYRYVAPRYPGAA